MAVSGFQAPAAASAVWSSTASSRCARRPKYRPASARAGALPGRPARTEVCAKAAAVAVSVGSVTTSTGVPGPASVSMPACRSTASTRTAVSKPREAPVRAPARSQPRATLRAARAMGARANSPSRSATWSRTFAEARTSETAAASRAPSPLATGAVRIPRSGQGPSGAPGARGGARLSLRQNGDEQTVVVRDDPGELAVVPAKCQAQPAQMGHPLRLEPLPQPVRAGSDYAEQTDSPVCRARACRASYLAPSLTRTPPLLTRTEAAVVFSLSQQR